MMKIITFVLLACALGTTAHAQESGRIRGFSIVLLLGEQTGSIMPPKGLSPSAQRAIADIKEFLPYKGYRVLDTQWVAGSEFGLSKGRIRGLEQKEFEFEINTAPTEMGNKPAGNRIGPGQQNGPYCRAVFHLVVPGQGWGGTPPGRRMGDVTVLENSFVIKPDETVVVGTSKAQGDSALIVLLTAVAADK